VLSLWLTLLSVVMPLAALQAVTPPSQFEVKLAGGAITSLKSVRDAQQTEYVAAAQRLGDLSLRLRRSGGEWQSVNTAELAKTAQVTSTAEGSRCTTLYHVSEGPATGLDVKIGFNVGEEGLEWTIGLRNTSDEALEIGDLALPLPLNSSFNKSKSAVLKHSFIAGHASFIYWARPESTGPYLTLTPTGDTSFEYWEAQPTYSIFIHSTTAGAAAKQRGTHWRQPHTSLTLAPAGHTGDSHDYGCKFRWANNHEDVRRILVEEGGIDVQVVPGMTVPSDLSARFALRSQWPIQSIEAEYPAETVITPLAASGKTPIYQVRFARLGENRLTVNYGEGRHMVLEFFATEPVETLIRKRAAFIASCQHRDPNKWYNGLFSEWNMASQTLLGPDNYDHIKGWRIYEVSCDDPGLAKPAFLAAKNAQYPLQSEVAALDHFLKHFVWGGLQRSTDESSAYGIYGIPDWKTNRDSSDPGSKGKLHIWRPYDYPHVILIYYSMYQVAKLHPQIHTELSSDEYLRRACGTALAMFTVPKQIANWSAYETGFYNELVIENLIRDLVAAGMHAEADQLRGHWERKVRHFINESPDLFRSEYAFDSTGFESTHALASYAMRHAASPQVAGTGISLDKARHFLETQLAANLDCRGVIEPAYYYLGSDYRGSGNAYTLTYMSQMGGWAVLDYALNFAADPAAYLRLGYASGLSSWALVNSGTAASNYGFWYPGPANDGAAGGGFEPAPDGTTWLGQPHHRGAWYYACEIDLGYCAALRSAATVLTDEPIFGRFCFGGDQRTSAGRIEVIPRDGLRRRFHALLGARRLHIMLDADRFAADQPIVLQEDFSGVGFLLESDNPAPHPLRLHLSGLAAGNYTVSAGQQALADFTLKGGEEHTLELPLLASGQHIDIRRGVSHGNE